MEYVVFIWVQKMMDRSIYYYSLLRETLECSVDSVQVAVAAGEAGRCLSGCLGGSVHV
jgi:hypothetical protein